MWIYEKKLQYPVKVSNRDVRMARNVLTQYGGADGEAGAALRYLNQRYSMPFDEAKGLLTDIGTEECAPKRYQLNYGFILYIYYIFDIIYK